MTATAPSLPRGRAAFQTPWELEQAAALCRSLNPKRVLEVGAWEGGSLIEWMRAKPDLVCVVDDQMRNAQTWSMWADTSGIDLQLVLGRSQAPEVVAEAAEHGPYDWVFIDADHTYSGVLADWEAYGQMVAPGGCVAFHDIVDRPDYGVSWLWRNLTATVGARFVEIIERVDPPAHGIGVLWV